MVSQVMLGDVDIKTMDYSDRSSRDESIRLKFADSLADRDFIFTQTALLNHTNERELRNRYGKKVVTIANFYFRGLFPDSCYVGDFDHRLDTPSSVHSVVVLDAFRRGLDEAEAAASFQPEMFARLGLFNAWASSMHEMGLREANNVVDVPGAALMEDACRVYPAFHTMNHPSALLLTEYMARTFRFAGLSYGHTDAARLPDPLAQHDTTPVLDLVAEHHSLPYRTTQTWRINSLGRRFVDIDEYVGRCYASYRAAPAGALLCHSPTDLVRALRTDPALDFLVDADASVPDRSVVPPSAPRRRASGSGPYTETQGSAVQALLEELKLYTHRIHSFQEVADPKIERIVQTLPQRAATRMEPPTLPPVRLPLWMAATLTVCAALGGLAGSLFALLL